MLVSWRVFVSWLSKLEHNALRYSAGNKSRMLSSSAYVNTTASSRCFCQEIQTRLKKELWLYCYRCVIIIIVVMQCYFSIFMYCTYLILQHTKKHILGYVIQTCQQNTLPITVSKSVCICSLSKLKTGTVFPSVLKLHWNMNP